MAKTNPFLKGMTESEVTQLRRKAPYVDQVYNPETNEVNYDIILRRLNDTTKKISDVEANFINQVKRNLQREYWANSIQKKDLTKTDETFSTDKDSVKNPQAGFSNYTQGEVVKYSNNVPTANQFFPEEFSRYVLHSYYGHTTIPIDPRDSRYRAEKYYMERMFADQPDKTTGDAAWLTAFHAERKKNRSLSRPAFVEKYQKEKILPAVIGNLTRAEKIFNAITSGVENVNRVYAENKAREKEQARQNAIKAVKLEAELAAQKQQRSFDVENFKRQLAARDAEHAKREEERTAIFEQTLVDRDTKHTEELKQRSAEFDKWRADFQSVSESKLKEQAATAQRNSEEAEKRHIIEMSAIRGENLKQAQDIANMKLENERIKSQNAILLKNSIKRRIQLKNLGKGNLHFLGMGQKDTQGTAFLNVLAGKNRYIPVTRRFNERGLFVENRGDTAVPDTFLNLISPQPQNRRK